MYENHTSYPTCVRCGRMLTDNPWDHKCAPVWLAMFERIEKEIDKRENNP